MGRSLDDLGTLALSWRDLRTLIRRWQRTAGTALHESVHGPSWSTEAQLLAGLFDVLQMGNWQRAQKKSAPKPKPIKRPWEKAAKSTRLGSDPIPISQFDDWWESVSRK